MGLIGYNIKYKKEGDNRITIAKILDSVLCLQRWNEKIVVTKYLVKTNSSNKPILIEPHEIQEIMGLCNNGEIKL